MSEIARRISTFVNDQTAPTIIRAALLSLLAQATRSDATNVLYSGADELIVSTSDLAFLLLEVERRGLEFSELGLMDDEGNFLPEVRAHD
jgi:hypothetical protein